MDLSNHMRRLKARQHIECDKYLALRVLLILISGAG